MATVAPSVNYDTSTAARMASLATAVHSALITTAGWVQTTDTGQAITQAGGLVVSITNIARAATVVTLSYLSQGATYKFIVGQTITVATSGTFTPTASGTFVITAVTDTGSGTATLQYSTTTGTITSVADTGTITLFAAAGGSYNRIYRAADSLQSTCPIFMKLRFQRSATGNVPNIGIQFGQGSDGAGNLTGQTTTEAIGTNTGTAQGASTFVVHMAGGTSWFAAELFETASAQTATLFAVERSRDNTGAETADFFSIITGVDGGTVNLQTIFAAGTISGAEARMPVSFPAHSAFNNNIYTHPWFPIIGKMGNPHIGAVVPAALVTNLSTPSISFYGTSHTFLVVGGPSPVGNAGFLSADNVAAWLMRYE